MCLKFVKWHLFHKELSIPRFHFLWGLALCLRPYCGTRCFFSVCAWLLWIGLKGGFAAVIKVVVATMLIPLAALCASHVIEPQSRHTGHISIQTCHNFGCYSSGCCHLPHHGGFSTLCGRRQCFSYASWYYCSTKISIDHDKGFKMLGSVISIVFNHISKCSLLIRTSVKFFKSWRFLKDRLSENYSIRSISVWELGSNKIFLFLSFCLFFHFFVEIQGSFEVFHKKKKKVRSYIPPFFFSQLKNWFCTWKCPMLKRNTKYPILKLWPIVWLD